MGLFVLCVAYLTVFVNCLVKQFEKCLAVIVNLLLNVMEVFIVGVHLSVPSIGFVYVLNVGRYLFI